jgi:DNA polymerase III subunit delta
VPAPARSKANGDPNAPIVLIVGDEELLFTRAIEAACMRASQGDDEVDIHERAGSEVEPAELLELLSPSLFGGRQVLVVRSAQDIKLAALQALTPFITQPESDTTIVLQHVGGAKGKNVLDLARKAGAFEVSCLKLTRAEERLDFIRAEIRQARGTISPEAAANLLDSVGSDLRELASVCAQLVSDSGGTVTADLVAEYHRGRVEVTGFAVSDRAVVGDRSGALENLRWALSIGVPHVVIADALADGVRSVARLSAAGRGNPYELAQQLGMPPWKVKRAQSQVRGWSEPGLRQALSVVADLNADVKGAAVDPGYALERAIGRLVSARAGQ